MKLYLARHGEYDPSDLKAALNERGKLMVEQIANHLRSKRIEVNSISHSGKLRAEQTAKLLTSAFVSDEAPQVKRGLLPNDDVAAIATELKSINEDQLFVGHLPFMSRLTSLLVVGDAYKEIVEFQTGTIVCLENLDESRWIIKWVFSPDLI